MVLAFGTNMWYLDYMKNNVTLQPGTAIKVRDKYTPSKYRRQATVIEDRGEEGVYCYVHHRAARGGSWQSRKELVSRSRIIL